MLHRAGRESQYPLLLGKRFGGKEGGGRGPLVHSEWLEEDLPPLPRLGAPLEREMEPSQWRGDRKRANNSKGAPITEMCVLQ